MKVLSSVRVEGSGGRQTAFLLELFDVFESTHLRYRETLYISLHSSACERVILVLLTYLRGLCVVVC
jgi:hypothetical protein